MRRRNVGIQARVNVRLSVSSITCLILTKLPVPGPITALCFTSAPLAKVDMEGKSVPLSAMLSNSLGGCLQLNKIIPFVTLFWKNRDTWKSKEKVMTLRVQNAPHEWRTRPVTNEILEETFVIYIYVYTVFNSTRSHATLTLRSEERIKRVSVPCWTTQANV